MTMLFKASKEASVNKLPSLEVPPFARLRLSGMWGNVDVVPIRVQSKGS
jgi:hypothetical protein